MPNANETMDPIPQNDAATTPIDLAQAFKMLNQANREAAQEPVAAAETAPEDNGAESVSEGIGQDEGDGTIAVESDATDGTGYDGSSDGIEAIDFNAYKQQILRDIQRNAADQVRKEFNDQNIGYYSAAELTVRDEQTGQVRFRNPDVQDERNPDYYFKSRAEMQQFIQAWNQGVDFEFRKAVNEKQRNLMTQEAPRAALIDFIPRWQAMDPITQNVFDSLLEGHEVTDSAGKTVGFNVNLAAVAAQAEKIAKNFGGSQVAQQQGNANAGGATAPAASGPAMDLKTGNGQASDEKEPTSIGEALKMLDKKNKGGK